MHTYFILKFAYMTKHIYIRSPDDFHHHLRDGEALNHLVPIVSSTFRRVIVMPNLNPPVTSVTQALEYRQRILNATPVGRDFCPLMTLYFTNKTSIEDIIAAKASGIIYGVKLYPAGATTNSDSGVTSMASIEPVLSAMEDAKLPLLIHGEVTDSDVDIFDREIVFIERVLKPLVLQHPHLKIVLEHITTKNAVDFIQTCTNADGTPNLNVAATITAHHLLYNRNHLLCSGLHPHMYCLPVLKRESHRLALLAAATSGDPHFFLGTDSAPHSIAQKECSVGCAGIFTGHAAIELYAEAFDSIGRIDALSDFVGVFGQQFYNLPPNEGIVELVREDWAVPDSYYIGKNCHVRPLRAGDVIRWKRLP